MLTADRRRKEPLRLDRPGVRATPRVSTFLSDALAAAGAAPPGQPVESPEDDGRYDSPPPEDAVVAAGVRRKPGAGGGLSSFLAHVTGHPDYRPTPPPAPTAPVVAAPELMAPAPVVVVVAAPTDEESTGV